MAIAMNIAVTISVFRVDMSCSFLAKFVSHETIIGELPPHGAGGPARRGAPGESGGAVRVRRGGRGPGRGPAPRAPGPLPERDHAAPDPRGAARHGAVARPGA